MNLLLGNECFAIFEKGVDGGTLSVWKSERSNLLHVEAFKKLEVLVEKVGIGLYVMGKKN